MRIAEASLVEGAVLVSLDAGAGDVDLLAVEIRNDDAVMGAVGDEEPLRGGVGEDLAREVEGSRLGLAGQLEVEGGRFQRPLRLRVLDELLYTCRGPGVPLAGGMPRSCRRVDDTSVGQELTP